MSKESDLREFVEIVDAIEKGIATVPGFKNSQEMVEYQKRLTTLMRTVEGCGCAGRGEALARMFSALKQGNTGVVMPFSKIVFKSFHADLLKAFNSFKSG